MTDPPGRKAEWRPLTRIAYAGAGRSASRLAWLVHPLTPQYFVDHYWQAYPVHLTGWPQRFADLFDLKMLRDAVAHQHELGLSIRVSGDREGDDGGADRHVAIDVSEIADHLRRGASICVDPIDRAIPALRQLAVELKRELGHAGPVTVKCYLSPDGFGFNAHFDAHVVTTLQIDGRKRWRISRRPGVPFPLDNAFVDAQGKTHYMGRPPSTLQPWELQPFNPDDVIEVCLQPGDVLCLPPGTWHSAKADGHSLALNVAFGAVDLLGLFSKALADHLLSFPRWRAGLPAMHHPPDAPAYVPEAVARHIEECAADVTAALASPRLRREVLRLWQRAVEDEDLSSATPVRDARDGISAATEGGVNMIDAPALGPVRQLQCVLGVADAPAAARWYERLLGCQVIYTIPEYGWTELATPVPGVTLGLTEDRSASIPGGALLDFAVPDIEAVRQALIAAAAHVDPDVHTVSGVATFLKAKDPDGNLLMFFEEGYRGRPRA